MLERFEAREAAGLGCPVGTRTALYLLLAVLACLPKPASSGLLDGLQLHLEFENNVLDSSLSGYDGQSSGGLQFGPGVIGQAAEFDGTDDQVLFPTAPDGLLEQNDLTIAYWFNVPTGSIRSVFGKREICALDPFLDIRMGADLSVGMEISSPTGNHFVRTPPISSGWHHVAFTRGGTVLQAFLDGQLVDMEVTPAVIDISNTATLGLSNSPCIGSLDGTQMLKGSIDDLRLYDRVLSQTEIVTLSGIFADDFESGDSSAWSKEVP